MLIQGFGGLLRGKSLWDIVAFTLIWTIWREINVRIFLKIKINKWRILEAI